MANPARQSDFAATIRIVNRKQECNKAPGAASQQTSLTLFWTRRTEKNPTC